MFSSTMNHAIPAWEPTEHISDKKFYFRGYKAIKCLQEYFDSLCVLIVCEKSHQIWQIGFLEWQKVVAKSPLEFLLFKETEVLNF